MLLSGGIDSATCLYYMRKKGGVRALTFVYHGIAKKELEAARSLASAAGVVEHRLVRLPDLKEAGDLEPGMFKGLPRTYIPMRNSIFYSFAASYAEEVRADLIVGGHNKDDGRIFKDAERPFFRLLERALWRGSPILASRKTKILLPVGSRTKAKVVKTAKTLGVPLELTWSCHRDGEEHCWECEGCMARARAFREAGAQDPLAARRAGKIT